MSNPTPTRRRLIWALRALVLILVIAGVSHTFRTAWARLDNYDWQLRPLWLVASGTMYLLGLLPLAWFWHRTLIALGQNAPWPQVVRAYFLGHLGKYVPGKALVLVLRVGLLRHSINSKWLALVSALLETLLMMAVGAFLAALLAIAQLPLGPARTALAALIAVAVLLPTLPPVARRIARAGLKRFPLAVDASLAPNVPALETHRIVAPLTWNLWASGWIAAIACWMMFGLSLWANLRAIGFDWIDPLADLPLLVGCVSLAVVAGFLSLLPGGLLVRDALVMQLLAPACGEAGALVAALLLRLTWLVSELAICGILYGAAFPTNSRSP
jgi:uncharacterized membrane protein YbhN (UPF0104 family)